MKKAADIQLYLNDSRGIYIPQNFAECTRFDCVLNVTQEDWDILLAGPDSETYWDTWADVLDRCKLVEPTTGNTFTLSQDGDLWLIPEGAECDDSGDWFIDDGKEELDDNG